MKKNIYSLGKWLMFSSYNKGQVISVFGQVRQAIISGKEEFEGSGKGPITTYSMRDIGDGEYEVTIAFNVDGISGEVDFTGAKGFLIGQLKLL